MELPIKTPSWTSWNPNEVSVQANAGEASVKRSGRNPKSLTRRRADAEQNQGVGCACAPKLQEKQNGAQAYPTFAPSTQQGVVIIEVMIAILIFSIGVLGIVGMQANMVKNTSESKYRADASFIAQQRIGQIWADPDHAADYVETDTDISDQLPSGKRTTAQSGSQFTVTIKWQQPGEAEHNYTTVATISGA